VEIVEGEEVTKFEFIILLVHPVTKKLTTMSDAILTITK
jgi:hypothetical protein